MNKFFYVYLAGGTIALVLLIYDVIGSYPNIFNRDLLYDVLPSILLYYLAYKVYHEKKDQELM
jgi:hypothetical protein